MDISGEYTILATQQDVWDALNDPEILRQCVPGCHEMVKVSNTEFTAKITAKIGMVKAKMKGGIMLSDIDAPNSYTITGSGQGGIAGFAKGAAEVSLTDTGDGQTLLSYTVHAELGGKLAAVGSRVIEGVMKKMSDDFFSTFSKIISSEEETSLPVTGLPKDPDTIEKRPALGTRISTTKTNAFPTWVKCALVNAAISTLAVIIAVTWVS